MMDWWLLYSQQTLFWLYSGFSDQQRLSLNPGPVPWPYIGELYPNTVIHVVQHCTCTVLRTQNYSKVKPHIYSTFNNLVISHPLMRISSFKWSFSQLFHSSWSVYVLIRSRLASRVSLTIPDPVKWWWYTIHAKFKCKGLKIHKIISYSKVS